ncbi:endolytic transglycosylase MltG [Pseudolysinimonas sp.]|uniref:endolytic transglycosylase MltG n=1 Tax=Pseudolysinimonas sp. TaxID=2680009 RepID=UPI00286C50BF|nr:endolytic transglycosylase MltG [Pseudolysinimonas sp.]
MTNTNEPSWDEIFRPAGGEPIRPQTPAAPEPGTGAYPGVRASDPFAVAAAEAQSQHASPPVAEATLTRRELREREEQQASRGGRSGGRPPSGDSAKPKKKRRGLIAILVILAVVIAGGGGAAAFAWINYEDNVRELLGWEISNDYVGEGNGTEALVTIASGDLGDDVARKLHEAKVTLSFDAVWEYLIAREAAGDPVVFFPGTFRLQREMSAESAVAAVTDPANQFINQVLITEGMSYHGALEQIAASTEIPIEDLQAAAEDYMSFGVPAEAPNLEGWMFPATYQFDPGVTAQEAIQVTVDEMFARLDALGVAPENRLNILKMAALVQRESGPNVEDMYKIARVFTNRLDQNMLLESDATVAYGTGNTDTVWTTEEERQNPDNLYSTYFHPGLPYGPIGLPGEEAIKAAITPAEGPWLFFVPINLQTGETVFSETASQHQAAAEQLYEWCRASDENASYCE